MTQALVEADEGLVLAGVEEGEGICSADEFVEGDGDVVVPVTVEEGEGCPTTTSSIEGDGVPAAVVVVVMAVGGASDPTVTEICSCGLIACSSCDTW